MGVKKSIGAGLAAGLLLALLLHREEASELCSAMLERIAEEAGFSWYGESGAGMKRRRAARTSTHAMEMITDRVDEENVVGRVSAEKQKEARWKSAWFKHAQYPYAREKEPPERVRSSEGHLYAKNDASRFELRPVCGSTPSTVLSQERLQFFWANRETYSRAEPGDPPQRCTLRVISEHREIGKYLHALVVWVKLHSVAIEAVSFEGTEITDSVSKLLSAADAERVSFSNARIHHATLREVASAPSITSAEFRDGCAATADPTPNASVTQTGWPSLKSLRVSNCEGCPFAEELLRTVSFPSLESLVLERSGVRRLDFFTKAWGALRVLRVTKESGIALISAPSFARLARLEELEIAKNNYSGCAVQGSAGAQLRLRSLQKLSVDMFVFAKLQMQRAEVSSEHSVFALLHYVHGGGSDYLGSAHTAAQDRAEVQCAWDPEAQEICVSFSLGSVIGAKKKLPAGMLFPFAQTGATKLSILVEHRTAREQAQLEQALEQIGRAYAHLHLKLLQGRFRPAAYAVADVEKLIVQTFRLPQEVFLKNVAHAYGEWCTAQCKNALSQLQDGQEASLLVQTYLESGHLRCAHSIRVG